MKYYCSSPNCRNECGMKYQRTDEVWRDPDSIKGVLFYGERFCDDNGNKLKNYDEIKKALTYF